MAPKLLTYIYPQKYTINMTINFLWKSDNIVHATMDGGGMLKTIMNSKHPYLSMTLNYL